MRHKLMAKLTPGAMVLCVVCLALVLLSGCSALKSKKSTTTGSTPTTTAKKEKASTYYDFGDVLVPNELKIDQDESFVFRTPGMTVGMLSLKGRVEIRSLTNFFENRMPVDGWRPVSSIEGQRTMMLFQKHNRWCVISITEGQISTTAEIWVSSSINQSTTGESSMGLKKP